MSGELLLGNHSVFLFLGLKIDVISENLNWYFIWGAYDKGLSK